MIDDGTCSNSLVLYPTIAVSIDSIMNVGNIITSAFMAMGTGIMWAMSVRWNNSNTMRTFLWSSSGVMDIICRHWATKFWCAVMAALGRPVVPDEKLSNAQTSLFFFPGGIWKCGTWPRSPYPSPMRIRS